MEYVIDISITYYDDHKGREVYADRRTATPDQMYDVFDDVKLKAHEKAVYDQFQNHEHNFIGEANWSTCLICGQTKGEIDEA